jgi:MSHA biogenesis protein MshO
MKRVHGFTLVEMVVALTLAAIVVGFAGMMLSAPIDQFALQTQRATLVNSATAAWPQLREDLRTALPNSARARRNGAVVVLEMLAAIDWARYQTPLNTFPVITSGTFRNPTFPSPPFTLNNYYLSVNNLGTGAAGADAYALTGSMSAASSINISNGPAAGEEKITIAPTPVFTADSPKHRIYLVSKAITYLCDETAGTLRRYESYTIAANQSARDTAAELAAAGATGARVRLLAQGITSCDFTAGPASTTAAQIVTTSISAQKGDDIIQLFEQAAVENLP